MIFKASIAGLVALMLFYFKPWNFNAPKGGAGRAVHDPMNIFCGSSSCYDVLGVNRDATSGDIRKVSTYILYDIPGLYVF